MRRTVLRGVLVVGAVMLPLAALAQSNTVVEVGPGIAGQVRDVAVTLVAGVTTAFLSWVAYFVKEKFKVDIEARHREAIAAFINRQASGLIAAGAVKLEGVKVDVKSEALASAARLALTAIPQALAYFNLTPDTVGKMIVDLIPKQPAVASAQAVAIDAKNPETPTPTTGPKL